MSHLDGSQFGHSGSERPQRTGSAYLKWLRQQGTNVTKREIFINKFAADHEVDSTIHKISPRGSRHHRENVVIRLQENTDKLSSFELTENSVPAPPKPPPELVTNFQGVCSLNF